MPKGPKVVVRLCRDDNLKDIQVAQVAPPVDAKKLCTAAANKFKGNELSSVTAPAFTRTGCRA